MQHHFILRYLRRPSRHDHHHYHTSSVASSINWVRDRALDHAVEKERDLKPMINLKNLLNSEPSKSLPLSIISDKRSSLGIPTRTIDFIRKYPSVFNEFLPGGIGIHPHVKLTPEALTLDAEEQIMFESEVHRKDVANRLLKLLMIARMNKIPLSVIDKLKWDLGLPDDYTQTIVPQFPDYFQVRGNELELVCWGDELAVSVLEIKSLNSSPLQYTFPLMYSRGFEADKKFKKWVDDWQKLPYISPYKNASSLEVKSEEFEKWVVGLMHEVLHLLVPKKTEKDNLLFLGEYLGVRSRFKKALLQHPGIFYVSSKLNTHTVVLREGYKRDLLVAKARHPLMNLRTSYIHLMNMVKEKSKSKNEEVVGAKTEKDAQDPDEENGELDKDEEDDSETEGVTECDSDNGEMKRDNSVVNARTPTKRMDFEGENGVEQRGRRRRSGDNEDFESGNRKIRRGTSRTEKFNDSCRSNDNGQSEDLESGNRKIRGRTIRTVKFNDSRTSNDTGETEDHESGNRMIRGRSRTLKFNDLCRSNDNGESEGLESGNRKIRGRTSKSVMFNDSRRRNTRDSKVNDNDGRRDWGSRKYTFDENSDSRTNRMSDRRGTKEANPPRFLRTEAPGARASRGRERSNASRTREARF